MPFSKSRAGPVERTAIAFIDSSGMTRETFRLAVEDAVPDVRVAAFPTWGDCLSAMGVVRFDMIVCSLADGDPAFLAGGEGLSDVAARAAPVPVLALVDTQCPDAMTRARECGAAYCVGVSDGSESLIDTLGHFRALRRLLSMTSAADGRGPGLHPV